MQRRGVLALGWAAATAIAAGGAIVALFRAETVEARLSPAARGVMMAVSRALLEGTLPREGPASGAALESLVGRIDELVGGLPSHAQSELSQLMALLASGVGRKLLAGLDPPWESASMAQIQEALQSMRVSRIGLRQQSYQALHDIVSGAYFSEPETWSLLGYPGPRAI